MTQNLTTLAADLVYCLTSFYVPHYNHLSLLRYHFRAMSPLKLADNIVTHVHDQSKKRPIKVAATLTAWLKKHKQILCQGLFFLSVYLEPGSLEATGQNSWVCIHRLTVILCLRQFQSCQTFTEVSACINVDTKSESVKSASAINQ